MNKYALATLLALTTPASALAQTVTFLAEGLVQNISGPAATPYSMGDPASLEFTFDSAAAPTGQSNGTAFYPVPTSYTLTVGTLVVSCDEQTFPAQAGSMSVRNDFSSTGTTCYDDYDWARGQFPGPVAFDGLSNDAVFFQTQAGAPCSNPPLYLLDNSLPSTPPDIGLANPSAIRFEANFRSSDGIDVSSVTCTITSLTIVEGGAANYCDSAPNSVSGSGASMGHSGTASASKLDSLILSAQPVPNNFHVFMVGTQQASIPMFNGTQCIASPCRMNPPAMSIGNVATKTADAAAFIGAGCDVPLTGTHLYFQCYYRDPGVGSGMNFSDGLSIVFGP